MNWPRAHPKAREEFDHAVAYLHENVTNSLARRFTLKAMDTVLRAREFPHSGSPVGQEVRRMQITPFPYDPVYLPDLDGDIYIVAFRHHRQRPGGWRDRV